MKQNRLTYIKNLLLPCFCLSAVVGVATGALIFAFKWLSSLAITYSARLYAAARAVPYGLPLVLAAVLLLGLLAAVILRRAKDCRGGGIPTAVAATRGLIPLRWVQGLPALFVSAMTTYLSGVPLGNEGPSVQMGVALGKGTTAILGRRHRAFERYIMTGGASAGFAAATGAPLSGILFALEEIHRRFSPTLFLSAAVAVLSGSTTEAALAACFGRSSALFYFPAMPTLPRLYLLSAALMGLACGVLAVLFTLFYRWVRRTHARLRVPFFVPVLAVFGLTGALGFFLPDVLGTGHDIIDALVAAPGVWYRLLFLFVIRAALMIFSNNAGVSGGVFLPVLTFGALIGSLMAGTGVALGWIEPLYYPVLVTVAMAAFMAACSRTPLTALAFAAEALCGPGNLLAVGVAVAIGYIVVETVGIPSFQDMVVEGKAEDAHAGRSAIIVDAHLTVRPGSFAVGKEVRDILWPPTCTVLSVDRGGGTPTPGATGLCAGNILHLHYATYTPDETSEDLEAILGPQSSDAPRDIHPGSEDHTVPLA